MMMMMIIIIIIIIIITFGKEVEEIVVGSEGHDETAKLKDILERASS
jgi:hypothetical protein